MVYQLQLISLVEIKRQNDIIGFKWGQQAPVAFHCRNLEVAEISEELWNELGNSSSESQFTTNSEALTSLKQWNIEINPEVQSGHLNYGIRTLTINVTQICNLMCTYCAAGGDGTYGAPEVKISVEKTLPQLKYFLDQAPSNKSFKIIFLGGEPLLYPEGIRAIGNYVRSYLLNSASAKNITPLFGIVTNGTLLNDENIELLKSLRCQVTVSLDGPPEINDVVRPLKNGRGSTAQALEGVKKLFQNKADLGAIVLHGVFNSDNMDLIASYEFYRQFPADKFEFTYSVMDGSDQPDKLSDQSSQNFSNQMHSLAEKAYSESGDSGLRQIGFFDNIFSALDEQRRTENFCGAGKSFLVVDAKNKIYTCPWDVGQKEEQIGNNIFENPQEALKKYSKPLLEMNNCQTCWARYLCGGGCMFIHKKATGSKNTKSPEFCQRMQSLLMTSILFYKKCRTQDERTYHEESKAH
jgi:uncharacterized protein